MTWRSKKRTTGTSEPPREEPALVAPRHAPWPVHDDAGLAGNAQDQEGQEGVEPAEIVADAVEGLLVGVEALLLEDRKTAAPAAKAAAAATPASADVGKEQDDVHTQRLAGPVANKMHASSVDWTIDRTVELLMASCSPPTQRASAGASSPTAASALTLGHPSASLPLAVPPPPPRPPRRWLYNGNASHLGRHLPYRFRHRAIEWQALEQYDRWQDRITPVREPAAAADGESGNEDLIDGGELENDYDGVGDGESFL